MFKKSTDFHVFCFSWVPLALVFAWLAASGCAPANPCSSANCFGCCASDGTCQAPSASHCGANGVACILCSSGSVCSSGLCVPESTGCVQSTCSGCCTASGCAPGTSHSLCGKNGSCRACQPNEACVDQTCVPTGDGGTTGSDGGSGCSETSCPTGCCTALGAGGTCLAGTTSPSCGAGGILCRTCGPAYTCNAQYCTCDPLAQDCALATDGCFVDSQGTFCSEPGTIPLHGPCPDGYGCGKGASCAKFGSRLLCAQLCDPNNPSCSTGTCLALSGVSYGVCDPGGECEVPSRVASNVSCVAGCTRKNINNRDYCVKSCTSNGACSAGQLCNVVSNWCAFSCASTSECTSKGFTTCATGFSSIPTDGICAY